jgi:FkbM family methyltransferase
MNLLLISVYPPFPTPEANHALHLSEHLARSGIEVHVLCQKGSIEAPHAGIVVHALMESWSFGEISRVKEALSRAKPDAVLLLYLGATYGQSTMVTLLPSIVKRYRSDMPFLTQFEAIEGDNIRQSWFAAFGRRFLSSVMRGRFSARYGTLLSRSDVVLTLSSPHRDTLAKEYPGVIDKNVILPPPPLIRMSEDDPASVRKRVRAEFKLDDDQFVFLFWGNIYQGKGLEFLLLAFELMRKEVPEARLLIVGEALKISPTREDPADYYQMVRDLSDDLGLADSVRWAGGFEWDSERGSEYLRAGDAFVLPLDWGATLNNSSLAAAATHGLPIIATRPPGEPDAALVHGQALYFCPPQDAQALADAMTQLATDTRFRQALTAGSRSLAEKWHLWPPVAEKLKKVLESAIAQRSSAKARSTTPASASNHSLPSRAGGSAVPKVEDAASRPLVSVIVAAYNVEKYISQCLDSLVYQTLAGVEIIAIDDASTDKTRDILEQYAALHSNLRVVALDANVGSASVRNVGLQHARGTYVTFLDGDDWADVRMCEILHEAISSVDAEVVSAGATVLYDDDVKSFGPLFDHHIRGRISEFAKQYCFSLAQEPAALRLEQVAWSKIYKRSFLTKNDIKFADGYTLCEDIPFHVECMIKAKRLRVIDDPVVFYRRNRPGQLTALTDKRKFEVFDLFRIVHKTAFDANVSNSIWAQIIRLELSRLRWLLKDRTAENEQDAFMRGIADCLREIPDRAWKTVRYEGLRDAAKAVAMRRGSIRAYRLAEAKSMLPSRLLCMSSRRALSSGLVRRGVHPSDRSSLPHLPRNAADADKTPQSTFPELHRIRPPLLTRARVEVSLHQIRGQKVLVCTPRTKLDAGMEIWRVQSDYYLTQLCTFRDNDIVVDVGAHVGIGAIHLAKMFPSIRIYAIEPDKQKFRQMKRNIELNGVENVHPVNVAVAGFNGPSRLFSGLDDDWTTINPDFASQAKSFAAQDTDVRTIGNLFQELGISSCRMLKISALGSVKDILTSIPPAVTIDYLTGEVDPADCDRATVEAASWRSARQHSWRMGRTLPGKPTSRVANQLPSRPIDHGQIIPLAQRRQRLSLVSSADRKALKVV